MKRKTQRELKEELEREKREKRLLAVANFVALFVFLFFFVIMTRPATLDVADDYVAGEAAKESGESFFAVRPPEGDGWFLTRANLRWLLREEIRLSAMRPLIHQDNETALKEYIAMLDDYNRCARNSACETADMKRARAEAESRRAEIEAEAAEEVRARGWDKPPPNYYNW